MSDYTGIEWTDATWNRTGKVSVEQSRVLARLRKDRGKEPQSLRPKADFPWFWGRPGDGSLAGRTDFPGGRDFDGNRWNNLHYTNAVRRAARERAEEAARRV